MPLSQSTVESQSRLSESALDDHVNDYDSVRSATPYISLSAGCVEYIGYTSRPLVHPAFKTALDFATDGGNSEGYVFRCWVITGLKPAPELPGVAEEIRDLNIFSGCYPFHTEGEIAAKLLVPRKQIHWVKKFGPDLRPMAMSGASHSGSTIYNSEFVVPSRLSNVLREL